jgi:histone deacetylase 1/2
MSAICGREGHTVIRCYKRFDASFQGVQEQKSASAASTSYNIDTNWYTDTGVTDHFTGELEKLTMRDRYQGGDQVHTASGAGMEIGQIGRSIASTPHRDLVLNNVLYAPQANKNLASVHRLAADNDAFFEFHPNYFFIKDRATKKVLLRGRCKGGLYPLESASSSNKSLFSATTPSSSRWHNRLGHPS